MKELVAKYIWCRRAGLVYIIWKKNLFFKSKS